MSYSFEYIDIILLAMIAGFIFLRLRGILGKRTGYEGKAQEQFDKILKKSTTSQSTKVKEDFDERKLPLMLGMINAIVDDKKLELDWEAFR